MRTDFVSWTYANQLRTSCFYFHMSLKNTKTSNKLDLRCCYSFEMNYILLLKKSQLEFFYQLPPPPPPAPPPEKPPKLLEEDEAVDFNCSA